MLLVVEQFLNGLQFGLLLFLLAAGLTLVFGIMDLVNLAHGSLYMMGAYFAATFVAWTGNFIIGVMLALGATLLLGIVLEFVALRHLYGRDHLDHVLATFGLILFFNDAVRLIWGPAGLALPLPAWLTVPIEIIPGVYYPAYRLAIILVALAVALMLYLVVMRTRVGMLIRAGPCGRRGCSRPSGDDRFAQRPHRDRGAGNCRPAVASAVFRDERQYLRADVVYPHRHPCAGGGKSQSHHGLWRHDEFRPRRLSRHR